MAEELELLKAALRDRYPLKHLLGRGGMSSVYLAEDLRHGRLVAVKVLNPQLSSSLAAQRFRQEIAVAATLNHPHIVPLLDSGEAGGLLYYVMPHVEGETLAARLLREGPLDTRTVMRVAKDVADALEYAHAHGIVHRDIKPENIMLAARHALITDFGVSRAIQEATHPRLTREGTVLGTPAYMSPEQAAGDEYVDGRSDIYSLGCVLYEMLAGTPPFGELDTRALLTKKVTDAAPRLLEPAVPVKLQALIEKAVAREPSDRYGTASRMIEALEELSGTGTEPRSLPVAPAAPGKRRRLARRAVVVGVCAALAAMAGSFLLQTSPIIAFDRTGLGESLVVLPFGTATSTPREDSLAAALAGMLTWQLNAWEGVLAVSQVALSGPMFDLGLEGRAVRTLDQGFRLGRAVGVETALSLSLAIRGDSAWVEIGVWDVAHERQTRRPLILGGRASDLTSMAASLTGQLLQLSSTPEVLARLQRYSRSPAALSHFTRARQLLDDWRLGEAEMSFRRAIEQDSSFALARHHLAVTLYWQAAARPQLLQEAAPEILFQSASALRQVVDLPEIEGEHVRAFHAFQAGDYDDARESYRALVDRDPADVHAWLLLGEVEYWDPWLIPTSEGDTVPRSNLNVARQAFENTVRLSPAFHLGYGHLFDIHSKVAAATWASEAQGFELPRGDLIAPWESSRSPASQRSFLPVVLDSIVWVDHAAFAALDPLQTRGGAQRLEDDLLRVLRRWVASAPDAVRPNREMTSWILDQLARLRRGDHLLAPERIDGMLRIAREHAVKALALSPDTVAEDLFQLADLHLAVGDIEAARTQVESALRMTGEPGSQRMAANVFMATGQVGRLLLLDLEDSRQPFFRDEQTGTFIPYGEGHVAVQRLRLLGATGVGGAPLSAALRQLDRAWSTAGHSDREQRLLRQSATWSVAPALALEPEAMRRWMEWLEQPESLLATLLRVHEGLTRVDRSNASTTAALEDPARTYVRALTEQLSGDHESALRSLSRLDSVPPLIGAIDPVWGFRSLSHALKAQSYEALGDSAAAQDSRSRFLELWGNADTLAASQTWLSEARVAAERRIPPPRP